MQQLIQQAALPGRHAIDPALLLKSDILVAKNQPENGNPNAEEQQKLECFFEFRRHDTEYANG